MSGEGEGRGRGRGRGDQPELSHTADTDDLEKRLKALRSSSEDQKETHSFLTLLSSTEPYSITANEKEAIKKYLDKSEVKVKFLKVRLIDLLLRNMYDATEQQQFSVDHKNVLTVYNLFNDKEKNGLYSYDLKDFVHNNSADYKEINDIVYKLKFINIIYLILKNNTLRGEEQKEYKEHTFKYKDTFTDFFLNNSRTVKMEEFKKLYTSWREKNPLSNQERSLPKSDENTSPVLNLKQQPETDIVSDTKEFNRIRNNLQEFIKIYNNIILNKKYQLKEQNGDKFEQLQYEQKSTTNLKSAPAFNEDSRWEKWDNEKVKGNIKNSMAVIFIQINDAISALIKKTDENLTHSLNFLEKIINEAVYNELYIGKTKYDAAKAEIGKKEQLSDMIKAAAMGGNPPTKYKSTGITVYILYEKKKYKRTVYTKDNRKTKYCKIDGKYILLSKLNVVE